MPVAMSVSAAVPSVTAVGGLAASVARASMSVAVRVTMAGRSVLRISRLLLFREPEHLLRALLEARFEGENPQDDYAFRAPFLEPSDGRLDYVYLAHAERILEHVFVPE